MKSIFVCLFFIGSLRAAEQPDLAGVWVPVDAGLRCMCGHETQLVLVQMGDPAEYKIDEYCLGHKLAAALGHLKRKGAELELDELNRTLKFTLSDDGQRLELTGDTVKGKQALILKRIDAKAFREALSKIPADRLYLSRGSMLMSQLPDRVILPDSAARLR
jgi:hypothetical protein